MHTCIVKALTTFLFGLIGKIDTKIILERLVSVMKIIKYEIQFDKSLKQRLEFICEFSKVTSTFKGCIRKMEKTNLSYI